jgi:hypothetical protein
LQVNDLQVNDSQVNALQCFALQHLKFSCWRLYWSRLFYFQSNECSRHEGSGPADLPSNREEEQEEKP